MNMSRKPISAVMTREVCQVGVQETARDVLALMQSDHVSSVLVIDNELVVGIITEQDIVRALSANGEFRGLPCVELMQSPVVTVGAQTSCLDGYHLMAGRGIRHLAVTDEAGHVLGIASEGDVMRHFGIEHYMNFKDVESVMSRQFCRMLLNASVADALRQMIEKHQSCVVVVDGGGFPIGVLTERDIVRLCNEEAHPEQMVLVHAMRTPVVTTRPRRRLHAAVKAMEDAHIRRLVVVDERGVACGLLTHHEVARGLEGDYVEYLKEIADMQGHDLQQTAQAIDEKLLFANILRSVTGTAILASDLEYRISYATSSIAEVLGLRVEEVGGSDIRDTLRRIGWHEVDRLLSEETVGQGTRRYQATTGSGQTEFEVSALLDARNEPQGYLVLARQT